MLASKILNYVNYNCNKDQQKIYYTKIVEEDQSFSFAGAYEEHIRRLCKIELLSYLMTGGTVEETLLMMKELGYGTPQYLFKHLFLMVVEENDFDYISILHTANVDFSKHLSTIFTMPLSDTSVFCYKEGLIPINLFPIGFERFVNYVFAERECFILNTTNLLPVLVKLVINF